MTEPLNPIGDGRGWRRKNGQFAEGHKFARGNPHAARVARIRTELLKAVTPAKAKSIAEKLVEKAEAGDLASIHELLDRTIGKPVASDVLEQLEQLRQAIEEIRSRRHEPTNGN